ncbi:MAG TPA: hypothetical protein VFQ25_14215 [Ktedonobacterales bacterium]|nr:hypothetical protein [Ktedonobacterales bacterium]
MDFVDVVAFVAFVGVVAFVGFFAGRAPSAGSLSPGGASLLVTASGSVRERRREGAGRARSLGAAFPFP